MAVLANANPANPANFGLVFKQSGKAGIQHPNGYKHAVVNTVSFRTQVKVSARIARTRARDSSIFLIVF